MKKNPLLAKEKFAPYNKIKPEHFLPATKEIIKEARERTKKLISLKSKRTFKNTMIPSMEISEDISQVIGPMGQLYSVMSNDRIIEEYQKCMQLLTEFSNEMSMDPDNYRMYKEYSKTAEAKKLKGERKRHLDNVMKGFILSGAELGKKDKEKLKKINLELTNLSLNFQDNVTKSEYNLIIDNKKDLKGLPENVMSAAKDKAKQLKLSKKGKDIWVFNLDMPSYMAFMKYSENDELKEKLWRAYFKRGTEEGKDNRPLIKKILKLRKDKANLLGFDTYAQYSLETKMAESPEVVMDFLDNIATKIEKPAKAEYKEVIDLRNKTKKMKSRVMMPWEMSFWTNKLKEKKYSYNENEVSEYFEANNVIEGFFEVTGKIYGLTYEEIKGIPVWHKDVKVYKIIDDKKRFRAYLFIDLYPRTGMKRPGAWMNQYVSGKTLKGNETLPQVGVHCNFTPPSGKKPSLLRYDEVTTLFHECGHALHGALSLTELSATSGARVKWDVVELPSSFHENFVSCKEGLKLITKHYKTGKKMPEKLMDKLIRSKNFMEAVGTRRQITFGMFDMKLHHTESLKKRMPSAHDVYKRMYKKYNETPYIEDSYMEAAFSHIFAGGYAAGYYSYMWANILDADAFSAFEEKRSVLDKGTGKKFMKYILEKGDSEDMNILFEKFRGRPVSHKALLKRLGIKED
ncbi:MAG: M3 family metallopeptidase [Candidatus Delongbacteria bacterium]